MRSKKIRGIISTILILSALGSAVTGTVLYLLPYGMWLGLSRKFINDTHMSSAITMMVAASAHLLLNWRMYLAEMRSLLLREK